MNDHNSIRVPKEYERKALIGQKRHLIVTAINSMEKAIRVKKRDLGIHEHTFIVAKGYIVDEIQKLEKALQEQYTRLNEVDASLGNKQLCPGCGAYFKDLSRHKCKVKKVKDLVDTLEV